MGEAEDAVVIVNDDKGWLIFMLFLWGFSILSARDPVFFQIYASIAAVVTAVMALQRYRIKRRIDKFLQAMGQVEMTSGFLETYYYSAGRNSRHWIRFTPASSESRPYLYLSGPNWEYLYAYGYRVEDKCCRGVYLAVIEPSEASTLSGELTASSPHGDWARAYVRPAGAGKLEAYVELYGVKARRARLELEAEIKGVGKVREILAETEGGGAREVVDLSAGPLKLVIAGPTEGRLAKVMQKRIAGLAPVAEYKLRLVLDIPLGRDVVEELPATPTKSP